MFKVNTSDNKVSSPNFVSTIKQIWENYLTSIPQEIPPPPKEENKIYLIQIVEYLDISKYIFCEGSVNYLLIGINIAQNIPRW